MRLLAPASKNLSILSIFRCQRSYVPHIYLPPPPFPPNKKPSPQKSYRTMDSFFDSVERQLLSHTSNGFDFPDPPKGPLLAYTDGSCPNNRTVSYNNPAGWGFAVVAARIHFGISISKVPGHRGIPGNEITDSSTKRAVTSSGTTRRYGSSSSLRPPNIGFHSHIWSAQSVEDQDKYISETFNSSLPLILELPLAAKKPWISEDTLNFISAFQTKQYSDMTELKRDRRLIEKSACKDNSPSARLLRF